MSPAASPFAARGPINLAVKLSGILDYLINSDSPRLCIHHAEGCSQLLSSSLGVKDSPAGGDSL